MSRDQRERFINQVEWELEDDMQLFFKTVSVECNSTQIFSFRKKTVAPVSLVMV